MSEVAKMATTRLPARLEHAPLVEAVFELRFAGGKLPASELLPGLLYSQLPGRFEQAEPLPLSTLPKELRDGDPNLRYQPTNRLSGPWGAVLVGDHGFSISKSPPYEGWSMFRESLVSVLTTVRSTGLLQGLERYSLKCVNVIESAHSDPTAMLDIDLRVGPYENSARGFRLRVEIDSDQYITVVEVGSQVRVQAPTYPNLSREGILISLDTINSSLGEEFWGSVPEHIDAAHLELKSVFFNLLTTETLDALGPVWE